MRNPSVYRFARQAMSAVALLCALGSANAVTLVGTGSDDGSGTASFTFDFGSGFDIGSLDLTLSWNPSAASWANSAATSTVVQAALGGVGSLNESYDPIAGNYVVTWAAVDPNTFQPTSSIHVQGTQPLTLAFTLASPFTGSTQVSLDGSFSDNGNPVSVFPVSASATLSAVPEPATSALMLGGLSALVGWTARRRRDSATA